jgi:hypothetical protein
MKTQRFKVLSYCAEHGSITAREAFIKLNINSPRKVISDIKNSGLYDVESVVEHKTDTDGNKIRWRRYFIKEKTDGGK